MSASREQSMGIEQVNVAITQLDGSTQQNAALVEQVSAAARAMESRACSLSRWYTASNCNSSRQITAARFLRRCHAFSRLFLLNYLLAAKLTAYRASARNVRDFLRCRFRYCVQ
jgi:Methyl-accepting chemotaxis protein (MCP) signaling domain.